MDNRKEVEQGKIVHITVSAEAINLSFADRHGETPIFVDSVWGLVKHAVPDAEPVTATFFGKYRSEPGMAGPYSCLEVILAFGGKTGIAVTTDGEQLKLDLVRRLEVFASTDLGTLLVSFYPGMADDARPLVMHFSNKKSWRIAAQHLAAAWLHEIWGLTAE